MKIGRKSDPGKECVLDWTLDDFGSIFGVFWGRKSIKKALRNQRKNGDAFGRRFGEKGGMAGGRAAPLYEAPLTFTEVRFHTAKQPSSTRARPDLRRLRRQPAARFTLKVENHFICVGDF